MPASSMAVACPPPRPSAIPTPTRRACAGCCRRTDPSPVGGRRWWTRGAYAWAGGRVAVEWLRQRGRPFLSSSLMTLPDVAACLAAVDLLEESSELVDRLWENTHYFKRELEGVGVDLGRSTTPITPVMLGEAPLAQQIIARLDEERG